MAGLLKFYETEDAEADQQRLASVIRLVGDFPGDEELHLEIHATTGEVFPLALPSVSPDFRCVLEKLLEIRRK